MAESNGNQPATRADVHALDVKVEGRLLRLEEKMDGRFAQMEDRFTQMEDRFTQMDGRFTQMEDRFTQMDGRFTQMEDRFAQMDGRFAQMEDRFTKALAQSIAEAVEHMQEFVRDAQTELLRGFDAFATAQNTRIRKVQADVSNVDAATDLRLVTLEHRMLEIEKRLRIPPPSDLLSP